MADEYDIVKAFAAIEKELMSSMIRNLKRHKAEEDEMGMEWSMWQTMQLEALEKYKKENQRRFKKQFQDLNKEIEELIRIANEEGGMDQEIEILEAIKNGFSEAKKASQGMTAEFFRLNERKLDALIEATVNDMQNAETAILRMANDQYRKVIYNAQVYANSGAGTYEKAVDMATRDFLRAGLNCVVYANGARHTLSDYADMALRTASKRAYLQGEGVKRQEWGVHTVIMNKRGNPCPKCLPFCGKVLIDDVWSGGSKKDGPYPLMSKAVEAGLYHPRCKDSHTTYFSGVSTADDRWTKEELDAIGEEYRQEEWLNYAKRQAEKYGRMAEFSLDHENQRTYHARAEEWQSRIELTEKTESGQIDSLRIGNNQVDLDKIKSDAFSRKFSRITDNTAVNESIRKYAKSMLTHRKGTDFEDLIIIDAKTGDLLFGKVNSKSILGVELTRDEIKKIKEMPNTIAIHNHPTNILPTGSDFVTAGYREYELGIVITHDLRVFTYKTGGKPFRSEYADRKVDKYINEPYNYGTEDAQKMALDELSREYGVLWKEMK